MAGGHGRERQVQPVGPVRLPLRRQRVLHEVCLPLSRTYQPQPALSVLLSYLPFFALLPPISKMGLPQPQPALVSCQFFLRATRVGAGTVLCSDAASCLWVQYVCSCVASECFMRFIFSLASEQPVFALVGAWVCWCACARPPTRCVRALTRTQTSTHTHAGVWGPLCRHGVLHEVCFFWCRKMVRRKATDECPGVTAGEGMRVGMDYARRTRVESYIHGMHARSHLTSLHVSLLHILQDLVKACVSTSSLRCTAMPILSCMAICQFTM